MALRRLGCALCPFPPHEVQARRKFEPQCRRAVSLGGARCDDGSRARFASGPPMSKSLKSRRGKDESWLRSIAISVRCSGFRRLSRRLPTSRRTGLTAEFDRPRPCRREQAMARSGGERTFDGPACSAGSPSVEGWRCSVYQESWTPRPHVARSIQVTVVSSISAPAPTRQPERPRCLDAARSAPGAHRPGGPR
jgi:hypothetical protein